MNKIIFVILGLLLLPIFCFAQNIPQPPTGDDATLPAYLLYIFNIGMSFGFAAVLLSMVYAGIMLFFSSFSAAAMAKAKDKLTGAASGFLILALTYLIVITINPQLNAFNPIKPATTPQLPANTAEFPGAYFYFDSSCSGKNWWASSQSIPDFSAITKSPIGSAKIKHDSTNDIDYISLVYSQKDYYGMCQYVDPNTDCREIEIPNIGSASIHKYGSAKGSVFIYRDASVNKDDGSFDKSGGFLEIKDSDIGEMYEKKLSDLKFIDKSAKTEENPDGCTVPKDEQDCKEWDKNGKCTKKECPSLTGTNISAIEIKGNYLVVLEHGSEENMTSEGEIGEVADFCQAYPSPDDINKYGPKQIKWDSIRNLPAAYPNWILIIPLMEK